MKVTTLDITREMLKCFELSLLKVARHNNVPPSKHTRSAFPERDVVKFAEHLDIARRLLVWQECERKRERNAIITNSVECDELEVRRRTATERPVD